VPSVLWRCWLGGRKGIRPVKTEWWGTGVVICLERDADFYMAQLMPLPLTVSYFSKIQIGFTFLVLAHPGSPGKRTVKRVCVCVCVCVRINVVLCGRLCCLISFVLFSMCYWQVSPAMSREHNEVCLLLHFYDSHDIWHFLSAIGLFISFMVRLPISCSFANDFGMML